MSVIPMNLEHLKSPFDPKRVSWRVGSTTADKSKGMALAYLDSRDVQDRLDSVCGPANWQCRYQLLGRTTVCEIGIFVAQNQDELVIHDWVWKADGAGESDIEAEKGALSDAFKRSAVKWGIGRYLYDLDSPWVEIEAFGKSYRIKKSEMPKLHALLAGQKTQDNATDHAPVTSSALYDSPEMVRINALKAHGKTEAEKGTVALTAWRNSLPIGDQTTLDPYIRLTLWKVALLKDKKVPA